MGTSVLKDKSYAFALRIVKLARYLQDQKKEFILSKQTLRSGTSIGAMIFEGEFGQSKADFINKMYVALKEANETDYWLSLLKDSGFITKKMHQSMSEDNKELIAMLVSTIKTSKKNK